MLRYLSPEWLAAANAALLADTALQERSAGKRLVIRQSVTATTADEAVEYQLCFDDGVVSLDEAWNDSPTVSFTVDRATAVGIAQGRLSAQTAFQKGSLRIGGDVNALIAHRDLVDAANDVLGDLRAETEFPTTRTGHDA